MIFTASAPNLQELFLKSLIGLRDQATVVQVGYKNAGGSETRELSPAVLELENPMKRTLLYPRRGNNPFATLAETMWVLAGRSDVAWLEKFLPRAKDFSDDGICWRAGYGPRLRNWHTETSEEPFSPDVDQIEFVLKQLTNNVQSRQAIISLWNPALECVVDKTKDFPCSNWVHFMIRDGRLNCTVVMRSNDVVWGWCLSGETKIPLLNGELVPIKDLVDKEFWVYSKSKEGNIVPGKVKKCKKTGLSRKILKITFDDDSTVRCTENHQFLLKDGTYREAKDLKADDSIDSIYMRKDKNGYKQYNNGDGWKYDHTMANLTTKPELGEMDKFFVTHHVDFDKTNNDPENLIFMGDFEHLIYHAGLANRDNKCEILDNGRTIRWDKLDNHIKQSELLKKMWENPDYIDSRKEIINNFIDSLSKRWENMSDYDRYVEGTKISNRIKSAYERGCYDTTAKKESDVKNLIDYNKSEEGREKSRIVGNTTGKLNFKKYTDSGAHIEVLKRIHEKGLHTTPEARLKYGRSRIIKVFIKIKELNLEFNEKNYFENKDMGCPGWEKITEKYFKNLEEIEECALAFNHRVVSVVEDGIEDVYDFEVEDHHNFCLENGVIVHNSSINVYEFTVLQEVIAGCLGIPVGKYTHLSDSFHIYDKYYDKMNEFIDSYVDLAILKHLPTFSFFCDKDIPHKLTPTETYREYIADVDEMVKNVDVFNHSRRFEPLNQIHDVLCCYHRSEWKEFEYSVWPILPFSDLKVALYYWYKKNILKEKEGGLPMIQDCIIKAKEVKYTS